MELSTTGPRTTQTPWLSSLVRRLMTTKDELRYAIEHKLAQQKRAGLLFGLQRSGTNYAEFIMNRVFPEIKFLNTRLDRSNLLHKHSRLYDDKSCVPTDEYLHDVVLSSANQFRMLCKSSNMDPDLVVVIARHPLHWLRSYRKWASQCSWPQPSYSYVREWTLFYGMWNEFAASSNKIMMIRYESLLCRDLSVLKEVANLASLKKQLMFPMQPTFVRSSSRFDKEKRSLNLSSIDIMTYSCRERHEILTNMDFDLLANLGYDWPVVPSTEPVGHKSYET